MNTQLKGSRGRVKRRSSNGVCQAEAMDTVQNREPLPGPPTCQVAWRNEFEYVAAIGDEQPSFTVFSNTRDRKPAVFVAGTVNVNATLYDHNKFIDNAKPEPPPAIRKGSHSQSNGLVRYNYLELEIGVGAKCRAVESCIGCAPDIVICIDGNCIDTI